ncbi:6,7-dimethyl-8-ribityllumazine synthase [Candidatus Blochmannia ocreatus (nom. nud.)]|uniref:6,7-dimethyl-8-ribityllumazine synthase n=1 Tax=Candidatus Blochmannia ocreatus (nom. nud.) TaxID=251538 RepID=A0ABY4SZC3_9ENTR|nr:6,7-dimethyl-8-ribityllumazine synthase [Candidatus Blochmannia ocreatus]URJ25302.1 6,7-dimethyl-8-ribityllumazine synthase [Candidatus Blochmannia ocreatus]
MNIIESNTMIVNNAKIAIIVARVNRFINNNLLEGALDILKKIGHVKEEHIKIIWVPGAYELPLIAKLLATENKYDAIITLGTIIKGFTTHFKLLEKICNLRLSEISINHTLPIGCGLLTTDNIGQAIERAGIKSNNKGSESALAVLEMINIIQLLKK